MLNATFVHFGKNGKASISISAGVEQNISDGVHVVITEELHNVRIGSDGSPFSETPNSIVLKFYDPKSIDVFISQLEICKRLLIDENFRKEERSKMGVFQFNVTDECGLDASEINP